MRIGVATPARALAFLVVAVCGFALRLGPALGEDDVDLEAGARKSQPCLSCHAMEHFARFSEPELEAAVQRIVAGQSAHIPLPLTLTDQDLAEIVAYLSAASRSAD